MSFAMDIAKERSKCTYFNTCCYWKAGSASASEWVKVVRAFDNAEFVMAQRLALQGN